MVRGCDMGFATKKKELKKLISDGKEMNFNPELISSYETQLATVENKIKEQKEERERFKLSIVLEAVR